MNSYMPLKTGLQPFAVSSVADMKLSSHRGGPFLGAGSGIVELEAHPHGRNEQPLVIALE